MIRYGCSKHGLVWDFALSENTFIAWKGKKPDWMAIPRKEKATLIQRYGIDGFHDEFIHTRLHPKSVSIIPKPTKVSFSDFF